MEPGLLFSSVPVFLQYLGTDFVSKKKKKMLWDNGVQVYSSGSGKMELNICRSGGNLTSSLAAQINRNGLLGARNLQEAHHD